MREREKEDKLTAWLQERGLSREDLAEVGGCLDEAERLARMGFIGWQEKRGKNETFVS
ncbi:MAG TPA: hypothetical protein VMY36_00090 [Patescibacteria group bacterium]|nr:hypothetical protein [Patescibacteria group bacterium]